MRVTPAGTPVLRAEVACGEGRDQLVLEVVMTGDRVPELTRALHDGDHVRAVGALRALAGPPRRGARLGVEVVASELGREPMASKA